MTVRLNKISGFAAAAALIVASAGPAFARDPGDNAASAAKRTPATEMNKSNLSDAQIIGITDAANQGEVQQANVAENRAHSAKVKSLAQMIAKDHEDARNQGLNVAKQLGMSPATSKKSAEVMKDNAEALKKLHSVSSDDFDKTFLKTEINEHEDTIKLIDNKLIPEAATPQVKSFLTKLRGDVEHHLSVAHSDLDALNNK